MEAKDMICDSYGHECPQLVIEAEISFKAGMREVVEWLKEHNYYCMGIEAKLKEWGIRWQ